MRFLTSPYSPLVEVGCYSQESPVSLTLNRTLLYPPKKSRIFGSFSELYQVLHKKGNIPLHRWKPASEVKLDGYRGIAAFDSAARFPVTEAFEFLLGLHPPSGMLREYAKEIIRKLATTGNAILVGRGGAMITAGLRHVLRVRLVAPFEFRVKNYVGMNEVSRQKAMRAVRGNDAANRHYIRRYFGTNISDPRHYDLIINTETNAFERAARVICRALQELMADQSGMSEPETAQARDERPEPQRKRHGERE